MNTFKHVARAGGVIVMAALLVLLGAFVNARISQAGVGQGIPNQVIANASTGMAAHAPASALRSVNFAQLPDAPANTSPPTRPAHLHSPYSADKYAQLKAQAGHNPNAPSGQPQALPVKSGAIVSGALGPKTPSPVVSGGQQSQGSFPSDMAIAVGDGFTVQLVNETIAVYSINEGTHAITFNCGFKTLQSFFGAPGGDNVGDPRAFYDSNTDRFFALSSDFSASPATYYLATTNTNSPCGAWTTQAVAVGNLMPGDCSDFPGFGYDSEAIYFTGDFFASNCGGGFDHAYILACAATSALCSGGANGFQGMTEGGNPSFSIMPALSYGTPRAEILVDTDFASTNQYTIWAFSNPLGTQSLSGVIIGNSTFAAVPSLTDPNSNSIDTGSVNVTGQPIWRNGSLYFSITSGINNGTATVPGILWFVLGVGLNNGPGGNPRGDTIRNAYGRENGQILFSGSNAAFYPSQAVDAEGDVCYSFNFGSNTTFATLAMTCRRPTTPRGLSSNSFLIGTGSGPYTDNRFGDYTATAFDNAGGPGASPACFVGSGMVENGGTPLWKTNFWATCYTINNPSI